MANVLTVVAKIRAAKGKGDALAALLAEQAGVVRKAEPGCLVYRPHRSSKDPDLFIFYEQYRDDAAFDPAGRTALILGAGGVARACALALARGGSASISVAARDPARAAATFTAVVEGYATRVRGVAFADAVGVEAELVVNATPLGARGDPPPMPPVGSDTVVVDLLTYPTVTDLQVRARARGATAFGGLGLLLHQAALSFELWTGQQPPLDVMSAAALGALADRD